MNDIMLFLSDYSFFQKWNMLFLFIVLGIGFVYFKLINKTQHEDLVLKKWLFGIGLILYFVVQGTPFTTLANHYLFSFKMVQESVSFFLVPLLLLTGLTPEMLRPILWHHKVRKGFLFSTHPLLGVFIFYMVFTLYHFPVVFTVVMKNGLLEFSAQAILLLTSLLMWWPIVSPMKGFNQLSNYRKCIYLFINSLLLVIPMLPVAFLPVPDFTYIGHQLLPPQQDFRIGAAIILLYQKFLIIAIAGAIFFPWFKKEDKIDPIDISVLIGVRNLTKK